jgi:hypothetical protein
MSRLFILFLIALLPLRGWTLQGMVFQMGEPAALVQSFELESAMGEDCALHMQQATAAVQDHAAHGADVSDKPVHKGCQNCQLCMALAMLDAAESLALAPQPQALPSLGSSPFASADSARDVKPPIS